MVIDRTTGKWAVYGGLLLGGGGGGDLEEGLRILDLALAERPEIPLMPLESRNPGDQIVTASLVGSPASPDRYVDSTHYARVFQLFCNSFDERVQGIITNELGAQSSTNGWILAARTGLPLLDAPCNGRAHPTGVMGSLGLCEEADYVSLQAAVGGRGAQETELVVRGGLEQASELIRGAATAAGGFVTVLRNPVTAAYVAAHGAPGALTRSIEIGRALCGKLGDAQGMIRALAPILGLAVLYQGTLEAVDLRTQGGFDLGSAVIRQGEQRFEISFWNEYMTVEQGTRRLATFPELICVLDADSGLPLTSAMLRPGQQVIVAKAPMDRLILGSTMRNPRLLRAAEARLGKELIAYVLPETIGTAHHRPVPPTRFGG